MTPSAQPPPAPGAGETSKNRGPLLQREPDAGAESEGGVGVGVGVGVGAGAYSNVPRVFNEYASLVVDENEMGASSQPRQTAEPPLTIQQVLQGAKKGKKKFLKNDKKRFLKKDNKK